MNHNSYLGQLLEAFLTALFAAGLVGVIAVSVAAVLH